MEKVLTIIVPGKARGKGRPRFVRRGPSVKATTDDATLTAENWVKACAVEQVGNPCLTGPLYVTITITVAIAQSWPKKKKVAAQSGEIKPTGKPDIDNTQKLVFDALNGIVWIDDSQIVEAVATKRYGEIPQTVVTVEEL